MRHTSLTLAGLATAIIVLLLPAAAQTSPPPVTDIAKLRADLERKAREQLAGPNANAGTKSMFGDAGAVKEVPLALDQDERYVKALIAAGDKPIVQVGLPGAQGPKQTGMKSIGGQKIVDRSVFQEVALALELPDQGYCSGVLIDRQTIITAAHCFCGGDIGHVKFGISAQDGTFAPLKVAKSKVRDGVLCPGNGISNAEHFKSLYGRDIGMLRLAVPVPAAWVAKTQSLPDPQLILDQFANGNASLYVVGFGHTDPGDLDEKSMARVPILSPDCSGNTPRRGDDADYYGCVKGAEILALDSRAVVGPCPGDSGGGAFITITDAANGSESTHLVGLVSRSIAKALRRCGDGAVYTLLTPDHIAWIEQARDELAQP